MPLRQSARTCVNVIQSAQAYAYIPPPSLLRETLFLFLLSYSYYFLSALPCVSTCVRGQSAPTCVKMIQSAESWSTLLLLNFYACSFAVLCLSLSFLPLFLQGAIRPHMCKGDTTCPAIRLHSFSFTLTRTLPLYSASHSLALPSFFSLLSKCHMPLRV